MTHQHLPVVQCILVASPAMQKVNSRVICLLLLVIIMGQVNTDLPDFFKLITVKLGVNFEKLGFYRKGIKEQKNKWREE